MFENYLCAKGWFSLNKRKVLWNDVEPKSVDRKKKKPWGTGPSFA